MVIYSSVAAKVASTAYTLVPGWTTLEKIAKMHTFIESQYRGQNAPQVMISAKDSIIIIEGGWRDVGVVHDLLEKMMSPTPVDTNILSCSDITDNYLGNEGDESNIPSLIDIKKEIVGDYEEAGNKADIDPVSPVGLDNTQNKCDNKTETGNNSASAEQGEESQDAETIFLKDISEVKSEEQDDSELEEGDSTYDPDMDDETMGEDEGLVDSSQTTGDDQSYQILPDCTKSINVAFKNLTRNAKKGDNGKFPCLLCDIEITSLRKLKTHTRKVHLTKNFQCEVCSKKLSTKETLAQHVRQQHGIKCEYCHVFLSKKINITDHLKENHLGAYIKKLQKNSFASQLGEYCCPVCLLVSNNLDDLLHHFKELHSDATFDKQNPPGGFSCSLCEFSCKDKRGVRDHMRRLHLEKKHQCPICNKKYGLEKDLKAHVAQHTASFVCEHCGKSFTSKPGLTLHVQVQHENKTPWWYKNRETHLKLCGICGALLKNNHELKNHMNKHNNIRPYVCETCGMDFYNKANLRHHKQTHLTVNPHVCDICGKDFKRLGSLRIHKRIHSAERLYKCETCSKTFTQSSSLKRHERIHTGDKPYPCRLCQTAFSDYSILRRHMLGVHKNTDRSLVRRDLDNWEKDGCRMGRPPMT